MAHKFDFNPKYGQSTTQTERMGSWVKTGTDGKGDDESSGATVAQTEVVPWYDSSIPRDIPETRNVWTHKWRISVRKTMEEVDLNKLSLIKAFVQALSRSTELSNVEVHVLWISHIPANLFQETISIGLKFTQSDDSSKQELGTNKFPGYLYTHSIFYPGHSIELYQSPIPWAIETDFSRIHITENDKYVLGKMYIKICGTSSAISSMEGERKSDLIAMAPLTQPISGLTFTRPRKPSSDMLMGYVKRGVNSKAKSEKLIKLMDAGVNIEGTAMLGRIEDVLELVPDDLLERRGDKDAIKGINEKVIEAMRRPKRKRFAGISL